VALTCETRRFLFAHSTVISSLHFPNSPTQKRTLLFIVFPTWSTPSSLSSPSQPQSGAACLAYMRSTGPSPRAPNQAGIRATGWLLRPSPIYCVTPNSPHYLRFRGLRRLAMTWISTLFLGDRIVLGRRWDRRRNTRLSRGCGGIE
jgi:hypothetical protein